MFHWWVPVSKPHLSPIEETIVQILSSFTNSPTATVSLPDKRYRFHILLFFFYLSKYYILHFLNQIIGSRTIRKCWMRQFQILKKDMLYLSATSGSCKKQNIWTSYNVFKNLVNIADLWICRKSQFLLFTIFLVILAFNIYKGIVIMSVGHLTNIAS